jgi:hypothetical protein
MDIEQMEDAKAAAAEACLLVINDSAGYSSLEITFEHGDGLLVTVQGIGSGGQQSTEDIDRDFSLALLQALTQETSLGQGLVKFRFAGGAPR